MEALPKSGWKDAQRGRQPYRDVWLSTEAEGAEGVSKDPNIMPFLSLSTKTVQCKRLPVDSQQQTSKKGKISKAVSSHSVDISPEPLDI